MRLLGCSHVIFVCWGRNLHLKGLRVHKVPGPNPISLSHILEARFLTLWYSFLLTEACCMAFTPQSSPTRVSTISCDICFTTSELPKKLYYIHNLLALNGTVVPSNIFYLESMEFIGSTLTMRNLGHRFNYANCPSCVFDPAIVRLLRWLRNRLIESDVSGYSVGLFWIAHQVRNICLHKLQDSIARCLVDFVYFQSVEDARPINVTRSNESNEKFPIVHQVTSYG